MVNVSEAWPELMEQFNKTLIDKIPWLQKIEKKSHPGLTYLLICPHVLRGQPFDEHMLHKIAETITEPENDAVKERIDNAEKKEIVQDVWTHVKKMEYPRENGKRFSWLTSFIQDCFYDDIDLMSRRDSLIDNGVQNCDEKLKRLFYVEECSDSSLYLYICALVAKPTNDERTNNILNFGSSIIETWIKAGTSDRSEAVLKVMNDAICDSRDENIKSLWKSIEEFHSGDDYLLSSIMKTFVKTNKKLPEFFSKVWKAFRKFLFSKTGSRTSTGRESLVGSPQNGTFHNEQSHSRLTNTRVHGRKEPVDKGTNASPDRPLATNTNPRDNQQSSRKRVRSDSNAHPGENQSIAYHYRKEFFDRRTIRMFPFGNLTHYKGSCARDAFEKWYAQNPSQVTKRKFEECYATLNVQNVTALKKYKKCPEDYRDSLELAEEAKFFHPEDHGEFARDSPWDIFVKVQQNGGHDIVTENGWSSIFGDMGEKIKGSYDAVIQCVEFNIFMMFLRKYAESEGQNKDQ